jgi:hypothetical protein
MTAHTFATSQSAVSVGAVRETVLEEVAACQSVMSYMRMSAIQTTLTCSTGTVGVAEY